jgi:tyrosine-protein phosphatase SIW14
MVASAYTVYQQTVLYHFKPVDPGRLYRSGTLSWKGLEKAHRMVGIKTIINLRSESEMSEGSWYQIEKKFAIEMGINLVNIPLRPDTPPEPDQTKQFLDIVTNPAMLPVLIHCEKGVMRTSMMVAVYKVAVLKEPNSRVLEDLPMFGHSLDKRPAVKKFILSYSPN